MSEGGTEQPDVEQELHDLEMDLREWGDQNGDDYSALSADQKADAAAYHRAAHQVKKVRRALFGDGTLKCACCRLRERKDDERYCPDCYQALLSEGAIDGD